MKLIISVLTDYQLSLYYFIILSNLFVLVYSIVKFSNDLVLIIPQLIIFSFYNII